MPQTVHITPVDDLIEHLTGIVDCPCRPITEPVEAPDGSIGWLITHHSLDGREALEGTPHAPAEAARTGRPWLLTAKEDPTVPIAPDPESRTTLTERAPGWRAAQDVYQRIACAQDWPDEAREAIATAVDIDGDEITAILAALAPHVTPTAPLRDLANEWDAFPNEAAPPYRPLNAHRCAKELREVIDRG